MADTLHTFSDFEIDWTRGRTIKLDLTVTKNVSGVESAQSLAGGTVWVTGKRALDDDDADAVFRLNTGGLGGVTVVSEAGGTAQATIAASVLAALSEDFVEVFVDCVWVNAAGEKYSFQKGIIKFLPGGEYSFA